MAYIALGNLVRNAIQHSYAGDVEIALRDRVFSVTDHGPGMSAEEIGRAYAAGVRRATAGRQGGLGLYIIQRICARFGWRLEFDSAPGRGTTARLDFGANARPA
jgi:signal transduction histidine kinase